MCDSPGCPGNTIGSSGPKWSIEHSICQRTSPWSAWAAGTAHPSIIRAVAAMASGLAMRFRPNMRTTSIFTPNRQPVKSQLTRYTRRDGSHLKLEIYARVDSTRAAIRGGPADPGVQAGTAVQSGPGGAHARMPAGIGTGPGTADCGYGNA